MESILPVLAGTTAAVLVVTLGLAVLAWQEQRWPRAPRFMRRIWRTLAGGKRAA